MERFFNTAGPNRLEDHYCIPSLSRLNLKDILSLIARKKYFLLHHTRKTGKTSLLHALMNYLNERDEYTCLYINVESAQAARHNIKQGLGAILAELAQRAKDHLNDSFIMENRKAVLNDDGQYNSLNAILNLWCQNNKKPIVLLIDEIDTLIGDTLIAVLRQLRSGYDGRPERFPQSIILCGVRDVRNYRIHSAAEKEIITGGSAFNIKAKSLRLGNFNQDDIKTLYRQHTTETGQKFNDDIFPLVWELTAGQPWLVNALAYETCFEMKKCRDRNITITKDHIL